MADLAWEDFKTELLAVLEDTNDTPGGRNRRAIAFLQDANVPGLCAPIQAGTGQSGGEPEDQGLLGLPEMLLAASEAVEKLTLKQAVEGGVDPSLPGLLRSTAESMFK